MISYVQMNSMAVQKVDTSTTMAPNENQSRTFLFGNFSILATEISKCNQPDFNSMRISEIPTLHSDTQRLYHHMHRFLT